MNHKLCELYNKYTILSKYTFHSHSFLSAWFSNTLECCKCTRMRFHCANSSGGPEYLRTHREHFWRCNANGRSQNALSLLHYKENDHVTVTITKKRFVGSNNQVY